MIDPYFSDDEQTYATPPIVRNNETLTSPPIVVIMPDPWAEFLPEIAPTPFARKWHLPLIA